MADLPYSVSSRVSPKIKAWLVTLAEDNHRPIAEVIRMLLEEVYEREVEETRE